MKRLLTNGIALATVGAFLCAPVAASAQSWHRQNMRNQWSNLALGAGAIGLLGALTHNDMLTYGGLAGAAYSGYRYEQEANRDQRYHGGNDNWNQGGGYGSGNWDRGYDRSDRNRSSNRWNQGRDNNHRSGHGHRD